MWNKIWNLKEGFAIGSGLILTGLLLQFVIGPIVWDSFAWPVNIIALAIFIMLIIAAYCLKDKVCLFRFSFSYASAVPAITFAVVLTIIMGLTRQSNSPEYDDPLGITSCLTFWPFVLIYLWVAWIVGITGIHHIVCLGKTKGFNSERFAALLSHLGLFIVLVCGTLGSADMQRLRMYCETGHVEWRALDSANKVHELPIAIQLDSFILEEYPSTQMEQHVPKRFASKVHLYSEKGDNVKTTVEVNKPYTLMNWKIYQYSYDVQMGKLSDYSVFELVSDPWLPVVYTGIAFIATGAFLMFFGRRRKEADYVG